MTIQERVALARSKIAMIISSLPKEITSKMRNGEVIDEVINEAIVKMTGGRKHEMWEGIRGEASNPLSENLSEYSQDLLVSRILERVTFFDYGQGVEVLKQLKTISPEVREKIHEACLRHAGSDMSSVDEMDPVFLAMISDYSEAINDGFGWSQNYDDDRIFIVERIKERVLDELVATGNFDVVTSGEGEDGVNEWHVKEGWQNVWERMMRENDTKKLQEMDFWQIDETLEYVETEHLDWIISNHPKHATEVVISAIDNYGNDPGTYGDDYVEDVYGFWCDNAQTLVSSGESRRDFEDILTMLWNIQNLLGKNVDFPEIIVRDLVEMSNIEHVQMAIAKKLAATGNPSIIVALKKYVSPSEYESWVKTEVDEEMDEEMKKIEKGEEEEAYRDHPEFMEEDEMSTWLDRAIDKEANFMIRSQWRRA